MCVVARAFDPSVQEAETGGLPLVQKQPGLPNKTLSQNMCASTYTHTHTKVLVGQEAVLACHPTGALTVTLAMRAPASWR